MMTSPIRRAHHKSHPSPPSDPPSTPQNPRTRSPPFLSKTPIILKPIVRASIFTHIDEPVFVDPYPCCVWELKVAEGVGGEHSGTVGVAVGEGDGERGRIVWEERV